MAVRKPNFRPKLKEGLTWQVEWWAEIGGKRTRVRKSRTDEGVDLNAVTDLKERRRLAREWISRIEKRLVVVAEVNEPRHTRFTQALLSAVELKASPKHNTMKSYSYNARWLCEYFQEMGWGNMTCAQVGQDHIQGYFDHLILKRKLSNRSHNTRKNNLRALFSELVARKYLEENFAANVRYRQEQDTIRRPLSEMEERVVIGAIRKDRALFFAYLVQRYLGVRPNEIRHLRCGHFNLDTGLLVFPGKDSKNNRNSAVTIPEELIPLLREFSLDRHHKMFFCLGSNRMRDNPDFLPRPEPTGENTLSHKFRCVVRRLHQGGALQDITGLQFYSLKDTLAVYMLDNGVDVESAMRHLRQRDLEVFQRYVKRLGVVNEKIKAMPVLAGIAPDEK